MRQKLFLATALVFVFLITHVPTRAAGIVTDCSDFTASGGLQNALANGGLITFACDGTIIVPEIDISQNTTIDATDHVVALAANWSNRIFVVRPGTELVLNGLTIAQGNTEDPDGYPSTYGGGLINLGGDVAVTNCTFSSNFAEYGGSIYNQEGNITITRSAFRNGWSLVGSGIYNYQGNIYISDTTIDNNWVETGAISNMFGEVILINSTVSNTRGQRYGHGAGIFNRGDMTIINSTISGNHLGSEEEDNEPMEDAVGGGIENWGNMSIINSTISNNFAFAGGGISNEPPKYYTPPTPPSLILTNSIVTNSTGGDCHISRYPITGEKNLIDTSCGDAENLGPVTGLDPYLSDNGGPTFTHATRDGSNALDAANGEFCSSTDQRGVSRPQGSACDIGAFEFGTVNNPPIVNVGGPYYGKEGAAIVIDSATAYDVDHDPLIFSWSADSNLCNFSGTSILDPEVTCADSGTFTVSLTASDGVNEPVSSDATVTVTNIAPHISDIFAPMDPVNIDDQPITASVTFSDPGLLDTHSVAWNWGDGSMPDVDSGATSPVAGAHTYTEPGTYTVEVTVTDKDGDSDSATFEYVVIYDPEGGFVTGGGWINSEVGWCFLDEVCAGAEGKANFGFVSKYQKGAAVPIGNTEFNFKAGSLNFRSDSYDWLVVAGAKAMFKGVGTINGSGNYGFMLSAIDAAQTPSTDTDLFRIKIWDKGNRDSVVYDNQLGAGDDTDPTTAIEGGNIIVHKAK